MKKSFHPRDNKGELMPNAVDFVPLIYICGTETHRLALHRSLTPMPAKFQEWHLSEPETGLHVRTVVGSHMGATVSSRGMNQREARQAAMHTLDTFLERIGSDKFNNTIAQAKAKWLGVAA